MVGTIGSSSYLTSVDVELAKLFSLVFEGRSNSSSAFYSLSDYYVLLVYTVFVWFIYAIISPNMSSCSLSYYSRNS